MEHFGDFGSPEPSINDSVLHYKWRAPQDWRVSAPKVLFGTTWGTWGPGLAGWLAEGSELKAEGSELRSQNSELRLRAEVSELRAEGSELRSQGSELRLRAEDSELKAEAQS